MAAQNTDKKESLNLSAWQRLDQPVRYLKGVGPKRAAAFQKLGIETLRDLTYFYPRRYDDRSRFLSIKDVQPGEQVTLEGRVVTAGIKPLKNISLFEAWLEDDSGVIQLAWFNQPYLKKIIRPDMKIIVSGKAEIFRSRIQMNNPDYEVLENNDDNTVHTGRIVPIYSLTEGLFQRSLRLVMKELFDHYLGELPDYHSEATKSELGLMDISQALQEIHFPSGFDRLKTARHRLVFDELFLFQLHIFRKLYLLRNRYHSHCMHVLPNDVAAFVSQLPFDLTSEQVQVIKEIAADLSQKHPMNRLLQGEVGSGKTIVAAFFLAMAIKLGHQAVFLAPTEVLAEQHHATLRQFLKNYESKIQLMTASVSKEKREEISSQIVKGMPILVVGTHAILNEAENFKKLALVVIDEQHKFGVEQRALLFQRNPRPHQLVMSATPIPRTLGLTLYGDLGISTIKQLPKGRQAIDTFLIEKKDEKKILQDIRTKLLTGQQAYMVYPIIDETENSDIQAAKQEFEYLRTTMFSSIPMGLVHGRLTKEDRDRVMDQFKSGKLKLLLATSVIEVGVDNPNATLMIVKHAERFGLSQLHQIRGRIGRGVKKSTCYLIADAKTDESIKRLEILVKSQDGFEIAERDLELRGPGEFFGFKQSGLSPFRLADLNRDAELLSRARELAKKMISEDPNLNQSEHTLLKTLFIDNVP